VEDGWFSDAVFIGDSRTDGLRLYSGIRDVDFLCYKGLTVFELMDDKAVIDGDGGKLSVFQALERKQYAKVYLMLGVNELGYNNDQGFADAYGAAVDRVRQLQPDAQIYLQSIVPVNQETCQATGQPSYITNEQIAVYNQIIQTVAADRQVYYVDVSEALVDESGTLPADASADGIHFHREGYQTWYAYLKTHTVEET
jgi:lysophospholipase L1-like esterase